VLVDEDIIEFDAHGMANASVIVSDTPQIANA
jgi:hypothetical protein